MIEYKIGNILEEKAQALVNPVNCVGVLALQFKKSFPENFYAYAQACKSQKLYPGTLLILKTKLQYKLNYNILNILLIFQLNVIGVIKVT